MMGWREILAALAVLAGISLPARGQAGKDPRSKPNVKTETVDLNQIDLEQIEDKWDSSSKKNGGDRNQSPRLQEIIDPSSEYRYASFGRPDPFQPPDFTTDDPTVAQAPVLLSPEGKEIPMTSLLQAFPLAELRVKGVWQQNSGAMRAVIATSKGEGVVVSEGDPISSGKVQSIARDKVTVRLYRLREDGVREFQDATMTIGINKETVRGVIRLEPGKDPQFLNPELEPKQPATALDRTGPGALMQGMLNSNSQNPGQGLLSVPGAIGSPPLPNGNGLPLRAGVSPGVPGNVGGAVQAVPAAGAASPAVPTQVPQTQVAPAVPTPSQRPGAVR